jgi:membrane-associated phospholipid phosphatase
MTSKFFDLQYPGQVASLVTYSLLVLCVSLVPGSAFNVEIFRILNGLNSPMFDIFWLGCTTLGDGFLVAVVLGCFLISNPRITFVGLLTLCLSSVMVHLLKAAMPLPRPVELLESVHVVGPVLRFGTFPSGHSAAGMSMGITLAGFSSLTTVKCTALSLATLIALSRVFVGAHFPVDIVVGMGLAVLAFGLIVFALHGFIRDHVWGAPVWESASYRAFYYVELFAAAGALFVYSPFVAESPIVAAAASVTILILVIRAHPNLRKSRLSS